MGTTWPRFRTVGKFGSRLIIFLGGVMILAKKFLLVSLSMTRILTACGGVSQTEAKSEQPTEVAGGFGLTCSSSDHPDDDTKSDFSCTLADANGQKYQDRPGMRLDLKIKLGDQLIAYIIQEASEVSSFTFTALKVDIDKIQILATIVDSNDQDNVSYKSYSNLRDVMKWEIVELPEPKDPDLAIKRQISTGLLWTSWRWTKGDEKDHKNHAGRAEWLNAVETCDQLSTFGRKWSLPTADQIKTAANDRIHSWLKDRYTNSPDRLWSKDEGAREDGTITKKIVTLPEGQIGDLLPVHDIYFSCVPVQN